MVLIIWELNNSVRTNSRVLIEDAFSALSWNLEADCCMKLQLSENQLTWQQQQASVSLPHHSLMSHFLNPTQLQRNATSLHTINLNANNNIRLLELRMTEAVATTRAKRCAKLQSNQSLPAYQHPLLTGQLCPSFTQPTVAGHWREKPKQVYELYEHTADTVQFTRAVKPDICYMASTDTGLVSPQNSSASWLNWNTCMTLHKDTQKMPTCRQVWKSPVILPTLHYW